VELFIDFFVCLFWRGSSCGNCIRTCRKITEKQKKRVQDKNTNVREQKKERERKG